MKTAAEVLLVHDNPGDQELVADLLAQSGRHSIHIHSVGDGLEAMDFCAAKESIRKVLFRT